MCRPKRRGGLGFRKLAEFNRALLAKKLWRLIRDPTSLAGRVLKGRYFRHGSVLTAGLGSNHSYIWRSLHWSKELLERGLIWRVGDGRSIDIFEDNWVPSVQAKIGLPLEPWDRESTVHSLIKEGEWDSDLINSRFNPYIAGEVLKLPLPSTAQSDILYWRFDAKGQYSVKDGCRLQQRLFSGPENQTSFPDENWWTFLWSLSLPPKVRLFWWNVSHDSIATNHNLALHHVPVSAACDLCCFYLDSTCHSLFSCSTIKHLWKQTTFGYLLHGAHGFRTIEWCWWLKEQLPKEEFEHFAILAWAIWKTKQSYRHGDRSSPLIGNIEWSLHLLWDFRKAKVRESMVEENEMGSRVANWQPPGLDKLKLNIDTSFNEERNQYSISGVLRDYQVRLLLVFGKQINQPLSVVHGELLAIREGVNLLYDRNFREVQVESDSLLAVQAVTGSSENIGYIGLCASEIREKIRTPVISDITHVRRSANNIAHCIARFAFSLPLPFIWVKKNFLFGWSNL